MQECRPWSCGHGVGCSPTLIFHQAYGRFSGGQAHDRVCDPGKRHMGISDVPFVVVK